MPQRVYNNIEGHRIIDTIQGNQYTIEDVTKIGLPTIKHPTTEIKNVSGMAMDLDIPNTTHLESAEFTLYHNNGINCRYLATPEKHFIEVRTVRQRFSVASGEIEHESVKYRLTGIHTETEHGDIETGSPYGSTEKYALTRYEEEIDGETVTIIDAVSGILKFNGVDYMDTIESLLN
jgi:Phage tail tube protein FII